MCGIVGIVALRGQKIAGLTKRIEVMSNILSHRGPDGEGVWVNEEETVGLGHRRLAIIDLNETANQPMRSNNGSVISFNGEIYNYIELRDNLRPVWEFQTTSDTECILASYSKRGFECVDDLRGMFSFAIWDNKKEALFCARDRFGIKPFYYTVVENVLYFASEAKALLPFVSEISTDPVALTEYFTFQYTLGEKTLFSGIKQLLPGYALAVQGGEVTTWQYWDVNYSLDFDHSTVYFQRRLDELLRDSVRLHGRSDVPVGSYVSGGVDSSLVFNLAQGNTSASKYGFNGRFTQFSGYDESSFAEAAVRHASGSIKVIDITVDDFLNNIRDIIYHLDFPVAGPGSFPQFMVSKLASEYVKVVLGGQGGDEIFGGYARYLVAYVEQALKASIEGTANNGNYVVTLESVIPNLGVLREYKPMIKQFWSSGLFGEMDARYFSLVNRSNDLDGIINQEFLNTSRTFETFQIIFNAKGRVGNDAYFDKMTRFDFKCLLPALLHVEDRMSMAHGIESRVPLLDHELVEFAATIPADIKFKDGNMKYLLKRVFAHQIPEQIINRRDKMGFPVPLKEWFEGELAGFYAEVLTSIFSSKRDFISDEARLDSFAGESKFSRKSWALISLELWYQQFHDKASEWKNKSAGLA